MINTSIRCLWQITDENNGFFASSICSNWMESAVLAQYENVTRSNAVIISVTGRLTNHHEILPY